MPRRHRHATKRGQAKPPSRRRLSAATTPTKLQSTAPAAATATAIRRVHTTATHDAAAANYATAIDDAATADDATRADGTTATTNGVPATHDGTTKRIRLHVTSRGRE